MFKRSVLSIDMLISIAGLSIDIFDNAADIAAWPWSRAMDNMLPEMRERWSKKGGRKHEAPSFSFLKQLSNTRFYLPVENCLTSDFKQIMEI